MSVFAPAPAPAHAALPGPVRVVNFNSPELNHLAAVLAAAGALEGLVRPYVNKGRRWERTLAAAPGLGGLYARTFGRRGLPDARVAALTREAGVLTDWCSAAIARTPGLPESVRHRWTNRLHRHVREAVARAGARGGDGLHAVVAYEGFALPAFEAARRRGQRCYLE
jgi:hypothetical protein